MKHWKYLKYLLKHKWYVAIECLKKGLWLHAITHDLSKFRPSEWVPYARYFYGNYDTVYKERIEADFDVAWLKHQKRNKHHWQYWVLDEDSGATKLLPIPRRILLQMACDWIGASKTIRGKDATPSDWYHKVKTGTLMNENSRREFEQLIGYVPPNGELNY
jgi:hypothetical protein